MIKVSDFGLSEDIYTRGYYQQKKDAKVKLPVKWMPPESIADGIFNEKSDVVSAANGKKKLFPEYVPKYVSQLGT